MSLAAELWAAVVKHCATGRGYRIEVDSALLTLRPERGLPVRVEPMTTGWGVFAGPDTILRAWWIADEAVSYAVSLFAPSTEPNVSC